MKAWSRSIVGRSSLYGPDVHDLGAAAFAPALEAQPAELLGVALLAPHLGHGLLEDRAA